MPACGAGQPAGQDSLTAPKVRVTANMVHAKDKVMGR